MLPHQLRDNAPYHLRSNYGMRMMPFSLGNVILLKEKGAMRESGPRQIDKFRVPKEEKGVWGSRSGDWRSGILEEKRTNFFSSAFLQFSRSVVSDSLRPHESQYARPPCPSPTPVVYPNPCLSSRWYHPTISSSVIPFSSCPQSLSASGSFPMSQLFAWGGQIIGVSASASVLPWTPRTDML